MEKAWTCLSLGTEEAQECKRAMHFLRMYDFLDSVAAEREVFDEGVREDDVVSDKNRCSGSMSKHIAWLLLVQGPSVMC